jgi:hypothetical protein
LPIRRRITGRTNTGLVSRDTSIVFIPAMSGTSTIRLIMSMSCYLVLPILLHFVSTDNPPPKVVQGYKVCIALPLPLSLLEVICLLSCSLTYFTRISSTRRKLRHTKLSKSQETTRLFYCISRQVLHTKTSHSELSTENGSFHISGTVPSCYKDTLLTRIIYSGFRSSFDRGCLSLWFNFRRSVSFGSFRSNHP